MGSHRAWRLSWEGSADGLSVTFKLRDGVTWHDGKPFTSADVAFSALQVWKPLQNLGRVVFKDLEAVDTPDDHTAVFHFAKPTPFQLIRNALPALTAVLPKHIYEAGNIDKNPANNAPVGTGPFKFAEHKPGEYYRLAKNTAYWGKDQPYLDEIVYQVLPDRAAAAAALEAEEIQLAAFSAVPLADLDRISKVPGIKVISKGYEGLTYQLVVEINHRRKELADLKVRQAIAHAIDKDFVVKTIFLGYADSRRPARCRRTTSNSTPPTCRPMLSTSPRPTPCSTRPAITRGADGNRFTLKLLPAPYFNETKQFGDYLRQALRRDRHRRRDRQQRRRRAHQGRLYRPRLRPRRRPAGLPRRPGDLDHHPRAERHAGRRAVLQPGRLRERRRSTPSSPRPPRRSTQRRAQSSTSEFQQLVAEDLPLINVAEWGFITRRARQRAERRQQSALGGLELGGHLALSRELSGIGGRNSRSERMFQPEVAQHRSRERAPPRSSGVAWSAAIRCWLIVVARRLLAARSSARRRGRRLCSATIGGGDADYRRRCARAWGLDQSPLRAARPLSLVARPPRSRLVGRFLAGRSSTSCWSGCRTRCC